jgi:protein phosphatase
MLFSQTDKGPREQNQDFFLIESVSDSLYLIVADGVGGNKGGQTASKTACETFISAIKHGATPKEAIANTHELILDLAAKNPDLTGMATTFSCVAICKNRAYGVHSGDSRIYLLRKNGLQQITQDHSEVARLLLSGKLSKSEASTYPRRNVLYSAIGTTSKFVFQEFDFQVTEGDRLLVMTDGIYTVINKKELRNLSLAYPDFNEYCEKIITKVIEGQTKDNYTLVGAEISSTEERIVTTSI